MSGVKPGAFLMMLALQRPRGGIQFLPLLVFSRTSKCVWDFFIKGRKFLAVLGKLK